MPRLSGPHVLRRAERLRSGAPGGPGPRPSGPAARRQPRREQREGEREQEAEVRDTDCGRQLAGT